MQSVLNVFYENVNTCWSYHVLASETKKSLNTYISPLRFGKAFFFYKKNKKQKTS